MRRDAGARQALSAEGVDPHLPFDLADVVRRHRPELRADEVAIRPCVVPDRGLRVCLAAAFAAPDPSRLDAGHPFVADAVERPAGRGALAEVRRALVARAEPRQDLVSFPGDWLLPFAASLERIPAASTPRGRAVAASVRVRGGRAAELVRDIDIRGARLAPVRHGYARERGWHETGPAGGYVGGH